MREEEKHQTSESYISVLKRHYGIMIILPICMVVNGMSKYIYDNDKYPIFGEIRGYIVIFLSLLVVPFSTFYLLKRKYATTFYLFITPIITIISIHALIDYCGYDSTTIYFLSHKEEYQRIIKNSNSIAKDGGVKLVKIRMPDYYYACERYFVYDESDEIANPKGNFRGIDYLDIKDINGNKLKEKAHYVKMKKYDEHMYIADVCFETGQ